MYDRTDARNSCFRLSKFILYAYTCGYIQILIILYDSVPHTVNIFHFD